MLITWNEGKNKILKDTRDVTFEQAKDEIINNRILSRFKNPNYNNQIIFIIKSLRLSEKTKYF